MYLDYKFIRLEKLEYVGNKFKCSLCETVCKLGLNMLIPVAARSKT